MNLKLFEPHAVEAGMLVSALVAYYYIKNGKLVKVEGDSEYPYNRGRLCVKGLSARQVIYHPDRLLYPMKRVGERGEGKWQRISWEEAFDIIERKLKEVKEKYGPEAVVFHTGTGRGMTPWISKLAYSFGSPNWITPDLNVIFPFSSLLG
jgi:anaerobic selenocysteine-containing dehydrogenase